MYQERSLPCSGDTASRKHPLYSGATLLMIVLCLAVGGACFLFTGPLVAMADRLTRRPVPGDSINSDPRLTDDQKLMYTITHIGGNKAIAAVHTIVARGDQRFVPVLIEMINANETKNQVTGAGAYEHVKALEALTGEDFREESSAGQRMAPFWIEWYKSTRLVPPAGFIGWKGNLLSRFDRRYAKLLHDGVPTSIRVEEIHFGEINEHVRPSLDNPALAAAADAAFVAPEEPVYGIRVNGKPRAYPARIVHWHKAVNDAVDGTAISLINCSQSATINCYDTTDHTGSFRRLETSGLVYRGNELYCDKEASSLWCQLTGDCIIGEPSLTNTRLKPIPVVLSSWKEWKEEHPTTEVARPVPAFEEFYGPPVDRDSGSTTSNIGARPSAADRTVTRRTRIYGLVMDGMETAKAYPLSELVQEQVINDSVGQTPVVLIANDSPLVVSQRRRGRSRSRILEGAEVRAYQRTREQFHPAADLEAVIDDAGERWEITEEALIGPGNKRALRINGVQTTWEEWKTFHPESELFQPAPQP